MNILFLCRLYEPHIGGVETHVTEVAKRLARVGHRITVVTEMHEDRLPRNEIAKGISIVRITYPKIKYYGLFKIWFEMFKLINIFLKADIVHIHDVFIWYLPIRIILPFKKVYITFHGWEGRFPIPWINKFQKKLAAKLTFGNITVGEYLGKYYNFKTNLVTYGGTRFLSKKLKDKKTNSILYLGRLEKSTGLQTILDSLKLLRKMKISFCGDGPLRRVCQKYGRVYGFTKPRSLLSRSKYCITGGYLSTLEALSNSCILIAVCDNQLKYDCFRMAPFYRYINIVRSPDELIRAFQDFERNKLGTERKVIQGYNWSKKQTWGKVTNLYLKLWSSN